MPQYNHSDTAYKGSYEQCVDVASFLWVLRSLAVNKPHYTVQDVQASEQRIELQHDSILTSIDDGWAACEAALEIGEAGEVFTATVIAVRSHAMANIQKAVEVGLVNEAATGGLISAMGWLPAELANPWIQRFLAGKDLRHKFLGIAACSVRRQDPGEVLNAILQRDDCLQNDKLHARALRLVGELRRQDLMPALMAAANSKNDNIVFWAAWSAILLGHKSSVDFLKPSLLKAGPNQERAIQLVFRVLPIEKARSWISDMAKIKELDRAVVKATGVLGDPHAVNWLITKMQDPKLARLAGEAFSFITGIDLEQRQLIVALPGNKLQGPNDNPADDNVTLDADEDLPLPAAHKVAELWQRYGQNFTVGQRYFLGRLLSVDALKGCLSHGYQRQRHAAALELALIDTGQRYVNTRARVLPT